MDCVPASLGFLDDCQVGCINTKDFTCQSDRLIDTPTADTKFALKCGGHLMQRRVAAWRGASAEESAHL